MRNGARWGYFTCQGGMSETGMLPSYNVDISAPSPETRSSSSVSAFRHVITDRPIFPPRTDDLEKLLTELRKSVGTTYSRHINDKMIAIKSDPVIAADFEFNTLSKTFVQVDDSINGIPCISISAP